MILAYHDPIYCSGREPVISPRAQPTLTFVCKRVILGSLIAQWDLTNARRREEMHEHWSSSLGRSKNLRFNGKNDGAVKT